MTEEKKPGLFAKLFGKGEQKKKNSCCCCGSFEIEEIEEPESNNKEDKNHAHHTCGKQAFKVHLHKCRCDGWNLSNNTLELV